ncbi:MAG: hypothetical protein COA62_08580 [Rhodobiaceae bacterium]|nr:MAG: hypothetical protein COA62_08580 [Rhodobiaceae bacterium]
MNKYFNQFRSVALVAALAGAASIGAASAATPDSAVKLLTANFETRDVVQVEVGDFHFAPGQVAPVHTHSAPAVGFVAKGAIIYQVEGEAPQLLQTGDVFYEPVGPRILRFDNFSATEEAIFIDFNLEQVGEPFIVFEEQPTEAIDRRTLPTIDLGEQTVDRVDIYSRDLEPGQSLELEVSVPTLGLVAQGIIEIAHQAGTVERLVAGQTFSLSSQKAHHTISNGSPEVRAQVITFRLQ